MDVIFLFKRIFKSHNRLLNILFPPHLDWPKILNLENVGGGRGGGRYIFWEQPYISTLAKQILILLISTGYYFRLQYSRAPLEISVLRPSYPYKAPIFPHSGCWCLKCLQTSMYYIVQCISCKVHLFVLLSPLPESTK